MVLFIKDGFYIIKDEFKNNSEDEHLYQQVWQGHYSVSNDNRLLRSTFQNGSGLEIFQLSNEKYSISSGNARGKSNSIVSFKSKVDDRFLTIIYPFDHFERQVVDDNAKEISNILNWETHIENYSDDTVLIEANNIITRGNEYYLFGLTKFKYVSNIVKFNDNSKADFRIFSDNEYIEIQSLNSKIVVLKLLKKIADNSESTIREIKLKPGEIVRIEE